MYENFALYLLEDHVLKEKYSNIVLSQELALIVSSKRKCKKISYVLCHTVTSCLTGSSGFLNNDCFCGCGSVTALKPLHVALWWRLVRRVTWRSVTHEDRLGLRSYPPLSCFPQVCVTSLSLFSPSSFLFCKWEFLSFRSGLFIPFNWKDWSCAPIGENTPDRKVTSAQRWTLNLDSEFIFFIEAICWNMEASQTGHSKPRHQSSSSPGCVLCVPVYCLFSAVKAYLIFAFH